jgi:asparagine synthase (glutamine-hydrolysing)
MANAYATRYPYHVVNDELINTYNIKALYAKEGQFDYGYNNLDKFTLENRFAPFVSTRMENCTLMAQSYGIEYSWPLLDVRLIQAFLSIPSSEKYHQGMGRYLHRRAIAKVVPKAITGQNSKYMGELVNNKFSRQIVKLNDDLHPDLSAVININKIRQQEKELTAIISADFDYTKPLVFSAQRNIQNINQLDYWLKYYFPNGCSWANTPNDLISK